MYDNLAPWELQRRLGIAQKIKDDIYIKAIEDGPYSRRWDLLNHINDEMRKMKDAYDRMMRFGAFD